MVGIPKLVVAYEHQSEISRTRRPGYVDSITYETKIEPVEGLGYLFFWTSVLVSVTCVACLIGGEVGWLTLRGPWVLLSSPLCLALVLLSCTIPHVCGFRVQRSW